MQVTHDKGYKGIGMEGRMAFWYARNTAKDMEEFRSLAARLARQLPSDSRILEVAPGPGYLAVELAKRGRYAVTGLDVSGTFVEIANRNAAEAAAILPMSANPPSVEVRAPAGSWPRTSGEVAAASSSER